MTSYYKTDALLRFNPVVVATWWEILFSTLFGVRRRCTDDGVTVTLRYWRGRYYVTHIEEHPYVS